MNQRNVTVRGIQLWKEKDGWVIRNGMQRSGCYIDRISDKQLKQLYEKLKKEISKKTK